MQFPHTYAIAQQKDIKICDSSVENGGGGKVWQVVASRNLNV